MILFLLGKKKYVSLQKGSKWVLLYKVNNINQLKYKIMKKRILLIATAVACMFGFSACTEDDAAAIQNAAQQLADSGVLGHIYLVPSNQNDGIWGQHNSAIMNADSLKFKSGLCCVKLNTEGVSGVDVDEVDLGVLSFGSFSDVVVNANNEVQFPLIGFNLRDTMPQNHNGDYPISIPTVEVEGDFSFIEDLNENNWNYYLTHNNIEVTGVGERPNIMIIAVNENEYYVCYSGKIHIDSFPAVAGRLNGQVVNVKAFRVTKEAIPLLINYDNRANSILAALLPTVTLNGEISIPRMTSENVSVIEALDHLEN